MGKSSGGDLSNVTIGYWYRIGWHQVLCHGPIDALLEVKVGERSAWSGSMGEGTISINQPALFGGERREGGVVGDLDVHFGGPAQAPNGYLGSTIGGIVPAFRRVVSVVFKGGRFAANNPNLKSVWYKVRRTLTGREGAAIWYQTKADISGAMNPAHICYECLTNPDWGMGQPTSTIDQASFTAAADQLHAEGFGLNLLWERGGDILPFLQTVMDHINGRLGKDPSTSRWTLVLIRDDYDPVTLPVMDPSNVISLDRFDRPGYGELVNEITVIWTDPATGNPQPVTAHNLASINIQGGVVPDSRTYPGIGTFDLAARVALRDLRIVSTPVARVRLTVDRSGWGLQPGDLFKLDWPELGIAGLVLRVGRVDRGTLTAGAILIEAVEDVFSLPAASYSEPEPPGWQQPLIAPLPVAHQRAFEVPYYALATGLRSADLDALTTGYGFAALVAADPQSFSYGYQLYTRPASADYAFRRDSEFCPNATLTDALTGADTVLAYTSGQDLDRVSLDTWALIDDGLAQEIVAVRAIDTGAGTVSVDRGVLDTTPRSFTAGARLWFAEEWLGVDTTEWVGGDDIDLKALTRTGLGTLAEGSAPAASVTLDDRAERPYPPGRVRIEGLAWPTTGTGDIDIAWAHRDRLQQTAGLIDQDATDIGPEAGTSYTVRVYDDASGLLKHTASGLSGTGYTYTSAQWTTDFGGAGPHQMRIEIDSQRDGLDSWQRQVRALNVS